MDNDFLTKTKFSQKVEQTVAKLKLSYIDAVVHICEESNIDTADVKKFLSNTVREKIEAEAIELNFLERKDNVLPI